MSSALVARTGRERQRYDDEKFRLVAGCIPYRLNKNVDDVASNVKCRLEVLMISSPNRNDLVFPKGGWEDDETMSEAASREALEEAGVKGRLDENSFGDWVFRSKRRQETCSTEGSCRGYMFALEVTEELESWPEQATRGRRWLSVREAFELCRYDWMRLALEKFLRVLMEEGKCPMMEDAVRMAVADFSEVAEHQVRPFGFCTNLSTPNTSTNPIKALC